MVAFGCSLDTAKKESASQDILNGGLRAPAIHSKNSTELYCTILFFAPGG